MLLSASFSGKSVPSVKEATGSSLVPPSLPGGGGCWGRQAPESLDSQMRQRPGLAQVPSVEGGDGTWSVPCHDSWQVSGCVPAGGGHGLAC